MRCLDWLMLCMWLNKQKHDKNSLWGNSHASSLWWWMPLMLLRERDSRCASEAFTICAMQHFAHRAINWIKTAMQGMGAMWLVELNTDFADWTDARRWNDKNRIKTPCGHTLMLRVCDGECLWCSYVNETHDVHQRHLPSSAMQHFAHRAINRIKTAVLLGCSHNYDTLVVFINS